MEYTLHQLKVFLKVTELQSITKASEQLHLTQPAVSIQLKKLQDQFPVPLIEVVGRQLYTTDFGQEIAKAAQIILNEVQEIKHKTAAYQGQLAGPLKVASVSTGKYVMPYFLSGFIRENSSIDLTIDVTNRAEVINDLTSNKIDFALVSVIPNHLKIECVKLMPNKLYLVRGTILNRDQKDSIQEQLAKYPLIYREQGSATRHAMEGYISSSGLPTGKKIELTSNEALKQALVAGLGYSIMPLIGLKNELRNQDLEIIPYEGLPIQTDWHLIWLSAKKLSPVAQAYLDYIIKEKSQIIEGYFKWYDEY